jgi:hypothetical protein
MPDLQQLADALAERLGRPVAIEDRRYRVLAYSAHAEPPDRVRLASILTREAPADLAAWLDAQRLGEATAPMRLAPPPELGMGPRVVVPVRAERGLLGFVWLIDDGVGDAELAAAADVAAAAAPLIGRLRDAERSDHALVDDLLGDDAAARERAAHALRGRGPLHVLAGDGIAPGLLPRGRLVAGTGAALLFGGEEALDALAAAQTGGVIGVSGARERPEDARAALAEAHAAAALARPAPLGRAGSAQTTDSPPPAIGAPLVRWDRLGAYQLLAPLAGAPLPAPLRRLLDHPDGGTLVATLEAYLDRAGDARAAAEALFIHRTSLYHRLHRIEAISGASLRDGDDRLALHVGLRIRRLGE